jgi:ssDNA-binding Zn-finger/Zn-ribbon topoisomerase 1
MKCPHCEHGELVTGLSNERIYRCNNFVECGRYVST